MKKTNETVDKTIKYLEEKEKHITEYITELNNKATEYKKVLESIGLKLVELGGQKAELHETLLFMTDLGNSGNIGDGTVDTEDKTEQGSDTDEG